MKTTRTMPTRRVPEQAKEINLDSITDCKKTMRDLIKYSLHPTVNSFNTDDRLELVTLYQFLEELLIKLRVKHQLIVPEQPTPEQLGRRRRRDS